MKRSLEHREQEFATCLTPERLSDEENDHCIKRSKRSVSSSGLAAMTLLTLAHSFTPLDDESLSSDCSSGRHTPNLVPYDGDHDEKERMPRASHQEDAPYRSFDLDCCHQKQHWRAIFKPLPLPPALPNCPAGAMATSRQLSGQC